MSFLYNIIVQPLIVVYDILFTMLYYMIGNPMLSILALGIVINFLALPLYRKADLMQKEETAKQKKMKPWLNHIHRQFSGDERFLIQQAYYKIEHYTPLNALKEAGPLVLQIPFFMAAYNYISRLSMLENTSFGPITNLLAPDALVTIGILSINILPIIMTAINLVSGYVYSKGGPLRLKIQIYAIAAIFLVLLYNSASGLVLYWIMNQIFSLGENIFYSRKNVNKDMIPTVTAIILIPVIMLCVYSGNVETPLTIFIAYCVLALSFIRIVRTIFILKKVEAPVWLSKLREYMYKEENTKLLPQVLLTGLALALLLGFVIPTSVMSSSTREFMVNGALQKELIIYPAVIYVGLFLLWMPILIYARDGNKRVQLAASAWVILGISLVNQFLFDSQVGALYANLTFDGAMNYGIIQIVLNLAACFGTGIVFLVLFVKKPYWTKRAAAVMAIAFLILGGKSILDIQNDVKTWEDDSSRDTETEHLLNLSLSEKNVVVFMLDRAIGGYTPYIMKENPEIAESFSGFTCYINTVSFGPFTNYGVPPLYGGYEYTPAEMNKRSDEPMKDKHDEALLMMPVLFSESGYNVTVCDPPYAGYKQDGDISIYEDYPDIIACKLKNRFTGSYRVSEVKSIEEIQMHNFVIYGLLRIVPLFMKDFVYDSGKYLTTFPDTGVSYDFLSSYSTLDALPLITSATNTWKGSFLLLQNATTHDPMSLFPPDYEPDGTVENITNYYGEHVWSELTMSIADEEDWKHYSTNIATYQELAKWLDKMKELGAYDNTRIIITSDHGRGLGQFQSMQHPDGLDVERVWPMLLVKDFDADGDFKVSEEFMTQADVPVLAMKGVIATPVNPFTGKVVNSDPKQNEILITDSPIFAIYKERTTFDIDGHWWTVHDSIFDMDNWEKLD